MASGLLMQPREVAIKIVNKMTAFIVGRLLIYLSYFVEVCIVKKELISSSKNIKGRTKNAHIAASWKRENLLKLE